MRYDLHAAACLFLDRLLLKTAVIFARRAPLKELHMNRIKRVMVVLTAAVLLTSMSAPCLAMDNVFKEIFENAFYGGLAGTLVGGALVVFTHKPADHLDRIGYGAATGVLVGATYGIVKSSRALAQMENGRVKFAMPTIMPDIQDTNSKGQTPIVFMAELIRGKF